MDYLPYGSDPPSYLTLDYSQACEILVIHNKLTVTESVVNLEFGGHKIIIVHGNGEEPDTYYVIPQTGYDIDKDYGSAIEGGSVTFEICPVLIG